MHPRFQRRRTRTRRAVAFGVIAALLLAVTASSASAGEPKIELTLQVAVKASGEAAASAAADETESAVVGELPPQRNIFLVEKVVEIKASELTKKTQEFADKIAKESAISWAVDYDENVGDTRFYAWSEEGRVAPAQGNWLADEVDLSEAHSVATGAGVTIALIDTGFDLDHPLLEGRLLPGIDVLDGHARVSDWKNGVDEDLDGRVDESHGHGTFVAGVIAQVAPEARILPIRAMEADGVGDMHVIIDAIDEAVARGVDIINISFGTNMESDGLEDAIERARKQGIVIVAAAGNHGSDEKSYPAAYGEVISVGAYDATRDGIARWGAYGDWIDVAAPGETIVSAKPGGTMVAWSGSSIAAPVVAAQAALLIEVDPDKGRREAEKLIRGTARKSQGQFRSKEGLVQLFDALEKLS